MSGLHKYHCLSSAQRAVALFISSFYNILLKGFVSVTILPLKLRVKILNLPEWVNTCFLMRKIGIHHDRM